MFSRGEPGENRARACTSAAGFHFNPYTAAAHATAAAIVWSEFAPPSLSAGLDVSFFGTEPSHYSQLGPSPEDSARLSPSSLGLASIGPTGYNWPAHIPGEVPFLSSVVSKTWIRGHRENLDAPIPRETPCLSSQGPRSKTWLRGGRRGINRSTLCPLWEESERLPFMRKISPRERHVAQPKHMPSQWCIWFVGRRRYDGDTVTELLLVQLISEGSRTACWRGRRAGARICRGCGRIPWSKPAMVLLLCSGGRRNTWNVADFRPPGATGAGEIVAQGDVYQQIRLLRHADVEDFEIRAAAVCTREYHLKVGGVTGVLTNALQRPQHMVVSAVPIPCMIEAAVDVVAATLPLKYPWFEWKLFLRKRGEDSVVGEPEILMEGGNKHVLHGARLSGARRI
jgi:hypothetical protein